MSEELACALFGMPVTQLQHARPPLQAHMPDQAQKMTPCLVCRRTCTSSGTPPTYRRGPRPWVTPPPPPPTGPSSGSASGLPCSCAGPPACLGLSAEAGLPGRACMAQQGVDWTC